MYVSYNFLLNNLSRPIYVHIHLSNYLLIMRTRQRKIKKRFKGSFGVSRMISSARVVSRRRVIFLSLGSGQTKATRRAERKKRGEDFYSRGPAGEAAARFLAMQRGNRSVPPWRFRGPPALPELPIPLPLLRPLY